jgi:phosphatidylserine/phosphatidylglycerophosphate/cardiolipin synthase-like enzyme
MGAWTKNGLCAAAYCLALLFACNRGTAPPHAAVDQALIQVYFSPSGAAGGTTGGTTGSPTAALVDALDGARASVLVQAYSFTSAPIAAALKRAHERGLDVKVILDKGQRSEKYSSATFLQHAGIPVWIDTKHAIAHNKVMVIDQRTVVTGSFNFTKAAEERNAENLLIIDSAQMAGLYMANWERHAGHSERY